MSVRDTDIAVIGLSGRFPGAPSLDAYWDAIRAGADCVSTFSDSELRASGVPEAHLADPTYVRAHGILHGVEDFDPAFFDMTPAEAALVDPQQRLFLIDALRAIEDAGLDPEGARGRIGVFAGASMNSYLTAQLLPSLSDPDASTRFKVMVANDKDFLATRVAYKLDLRGASYTVQTACSTSLVAVHLACQSLLSGENAVALAGGATLKVPQIVGYHFEDGQVFSPGGRIRAFDAGADGIVLGNGVGVVVLKPLADAFADGDRVRAVIRATATNNDGGFKASYSAPSREGQARVIAEALDLAETPADTIGYVEAHGTGTELGDPVEVAGLTQAFRRTTDQCGYCALGSVKANIGHLDAAAGIAGLIKVVLILERQAIPPLAHFTAPNPHIDFTTTPFRPTTTATTWDSDQPRRAGVSSFGIGGTNAHAILEEAPAVQASGPPSAPVPLWLSAKGEAALDTLTDTVRDALSAAPTPEARADLAYTLTVGRRQFDHRRVFTLDPEDGSLHGGDGALVDRANAPTTPPEPAGERARVLAELGAAWLAGAPVDRAALFAGERRHKVAAPGHPLAGVRCWIDPPEATDPPSAFLLFRRTWQPVPSASAPPDASSRTLLRTCDAPECPDATRLDGDDFAACLWSLIDALRRGNASERPALQILAPPGPVAAGLAAFLRTLRLEVPRIRGQLIECGSDAVAALEAAMGHPTQTYLRWHQGVLSMPVWRETKAQAPSPWRRGETYLITGGLGGIGRAIAAQIVGEGARALLLSRSAPSEPLPDGAIHLRADVADLGALRAALAGEQLSGVLHAAGTLCDGLIKNLTEADMAAVLRAKVTGLRALDDATAEHPLTFFVGFSSAVTVIGNPGQAGYAAANAWMERYLAERADDPTRPGTSLAVAWPIWAEGGMRASAAATAAMAQKTGMVPMATANGLKALAAAIASGASELLAIQGDLARARAYFVAPATTAPETVIHRLVDPPVVSAERVAEGLKRLFAGPIGWDPQAVDPSVPFERYGVDSVVLAELTLALGDVFDGASRTLLYEYRSLAELAEYLTSEHSADCARWLGIAAMPSTSTEPPNRTADKSLATPAKPPAEPSRADPSEPVAIIGLALRLPGAPHRAAFAEQLFTGASAIRDLPPARWPSEEFYDPDPERAVASGMTYLQSGGFLDEVAGFDAAFFGLAPRDALAMDPQERLFLETAWLALEDAGYAPEALPDGRRAGVYGGATKTGYALWSGPSGLTTTSFASMVNRVSHTLDLHGPSVAVDAMCASSHVAVLSALEALRRGEIDLALAGAVNLYLHPTSLASLCHVGMAARRVPDGAFMAGGAGFVPSEGVVVAVLKRLCDAERDGDDVLALIRGGALNHSGRANAYYAPDLHQQAAAIEAGLADARVAAAKIDWIELAANGDETTDAVEQAALKRVFGPSGGTRRMGSVKALIGHGEAVSGLAQLAKVVAQFQAGRRAPTPLSATPTGEIDIASGAFALQDVAEPWPASEVPRRAGIDGFGAGGVNAHLVLEDYPPRPAAETTGPFLFILSAKTESALRGMIAAWRAFLAAHPRLDLARATWTLQIGRAALPWRIACVVDSVAELDAALDVAQPAQAGQHPPAPLGPDLATWARAWLGGAALDWVGLYEAPPRRLAGLPGYAFEHRRFWPEAASSVHPLARPDGRSAPCSHTPAPVSANQQGVANDPRILVERELRHALGMDPDEPLDPSAPFVTLGLSSLLLVRFVHGLSNALGLKLAETIVFEHPTLDALVAYLARRGTDPAADAVERRVAPPEPTAHDDLDALLSGVAGGELSIDEALARLDRT